MKHENNILQYNVMLELRHTRMRRKENDTQAKQFLF